MDDPGKTTGRKARIEEDETAPFTIGDDGSGASDPLPKTGDNGADLRERTCPTCKERYPADFNLCPKDGTALFEVAENRDLLVGTVLGGTYRILRCIGEGGMARVYEAEHTRVKTRRFAVKVLNADLARQAEFVTRFEREVQAAASIDHEGIVEVFDVAATADGRPYIVSEFLGGLELGDLLARAGRLEPAFAVRIARLAGLALEAAHAAGVVHRDIKPENLFLVGSRAAPRVKLLDFGISRIGDGRGTALTRTGAILGTPAFMSPEQARGGKVDHRTDIYSLGAILYRCVTGKRPFDSEDVTATLTALLTEEPVRPRAVNPAIAEELEVVIQKAMARDPQERYSSAEAFAQALAQFDRGGDVPTPDALEMLAGERSGPDLATAIPPARREVRMARPSIALFGALAMLFVLLGLCDLIVGVVRWASGAEISPIESILIMAGVAAALFTPAFFLFHKVRRRLWGNSARAVDAASVVRGVTSSALAVYGFAALLTSFACGVVLHRASLALWPGFRVLFFAAAAAAAGIAVLVRILRRDPP
jgi:serine/threonine-protein kinase